MASRKDKEQRVGGQHVCVGTEHDPEERPGVMGSVMRAVHSAKEAVVGKSRNDHGRRDEDVDYYAGDGGDRSREEMTESDPGAMDEKTREAKERAKERTGEMTEKAKEAAGETKDYTAEKARESAKKTKETAESAKEKTKETAESAKEKTTETAESSADKTKEKAQEAKEKSKETAQSAVDKTKETTQSATSKLGELKGKAMGFFSGKKEDAKEQTYDTAEAKLRESEEETRRRMEELRLKGRDEYEGDVAQRVREDKDESKRGGGGILGSLKEKLTSHRTPSDHDRSRPVDESREPRTREEKQVVVEDVSPGAVESHSEGI